jgi:Na+-translocating ferredoxin:NAD+ oxidoreductase RNF subunit RnfB
MSDVLLAAAIMAGLGILLGVLLAFAYRFLRVPEDPRQQRVEQLLPGTNCGGCGEPGCRAFAEAVIAGKRPPSGCTVSSPEGVAAIAAFLGVEAGTLDRKVARLHCAGGRAQAVQIAAYEGFESCRAAHVTGGGGKGCSWGCLGLADCQVACSFGAITMNGNGLPVVAPDKCTACGDCVVACPRDLFELLPLRQPLLVQCRVPLAGEAARKLCAVACDACGRCAQDAPPGLIRMVDNLPVVDYTQNVDAGPAPTFRCPTSAIQFVPKGQFSAAEVRA